MAVERGDGPSSRYVQTDACTYSPEPGPGYSFPMAMRQDSNKFRNCEMSEVESELRRRCSTWRIARWTVSS